MAERKNFSILLMKNIESFPNLLEVQSGFIDIWWIIHDGGLLLLLAFLLKEHRVWSKCTLRLFTICLENENVNLRRKQLEQYIYHLRIEAQVHPVVVSDGEISAFQKYQTINGENLDDSSTSELKCRVNETSGKQVSSKTLE